MQTVKQFMSSLKAAGAPADTRHQVNAWPYPQAAQSHVVIFRESWPHDPGKLPERQIRVPLDNAGTPGALLRVRPGSTRPADVAKILAD